jgi:hypothetical protein
VCRVRAVQYVNKLDTDVAAAPPLLYGSARLLITADRLIDNGVASCTRSKPTKGGRADISDRIIVAYLGPAGAMIARRYESRRDHIARASGIHRIPHSAAGHCGVRASRKRSRMAAYQYLVDCRQKAEDGRELTTAYPRR